MKIKNINRAATAELGKEKKDCVGLLGGEIFQCINSFTGEGCGKNSECLECPVRSSVMHTFETGENIYKKEGDLDIVTNGRPTPIHFLISTTLLQHSNEPIVLLIVDDITRYKQSEIKFLETAAKNEAILNVLPDLIFECKRDGTIVDYRASTEDDLYVPPNEFLGRKVIEMLPKEVAWKTMHSIEQAIQTKELQSFQYQLPANGKMFDFEARLVACGEDSALAIVSDITERKQMEKALLNSETSLSNAQRIANLGNWDWDIVNNELHWSDEIYNIFGLEPLESRATYEAFVKSIHPDDRMFVQDAVNKAVYENKPYGIDHRILLPDGSERIVHEQGEVTFNKTGQAIRMVGIVQDVTERKKAEKALQESDEKYHNLAESLNELIYRADPETLVSTYVNQAVERIYGYTVEEWLNNPDLWEKSIYPADKERVFAEFTELQNKLESGIIEYRIIKKDKNVRWVHDHINWEKDQQGNGISVNGILYDITERKRIEKDLRESEDKFKTIFESANDAIYLTDLNGQFLEVNQMACDQLGYSRSELIQKSPQNIDSFDDAAQIENRINQLFQDEHILFETNHVRKDGSIMPVEVNIRLIDCMGEKAILGISRDITKHKQAEIMLREKAEAEAANISKSKFLANMSHELRTPLNSIIGFSQMLNSNPFGNLNEKETKYSYNIITSGKHLLDLINDILDISKIESGEMELEFEKFSLSFFICDMVNIIKHLADEKNIEICNQFRSESIEMHADRLRMKQILYNLLSNSLKFTPENGCI
ncbi:PAS domain S-box protein [Methanococcoides sp. SA1]|nr:PAS domain S-box protein [Methanococcoides sp. SA1]